MLPRRQVECRASHLGPHVLVRCHQLERGSERVCFLLVGRHLNKLALQLQEPSQTLVYSIYFAIPHLELFDVRDLIIHDLGSIEWLIWFGAMGYAAVYAALFLVAACLLFRRKALS